MSPHEGLQPLWRDRDTFVVLDTAFAHGARFIGAWRAWRDDPQRCGHLVFIAIDDPMPTRAEIEAWAVETESPDLAGELCRNWPPMTANLHRLGFEDGRVELLLAPGELRRWLPELVAEVDYFRLDAASWDEQLCKALGRLAAVGANLVAFDRSLALRRHLATAGFVWSSDDQALAPDAATAHFAPAYASRAPRRPTARARIAQRDPRHAVIVGGGLAGSAAAWALAERGWSSLLIERNERLADEASGNPGGLFHGIVNAQDGMHARFNRAAALAAHEVVRRAIDDGVAGSADGLLRLETAAELASMYETLRRVRLPVDYVRAVDAVEASGLAGVTLNAPCWFYPQGGWVSPRGLAAWLCARAGARVELRCGTAVDRLEACDAGWRLLDVFEQTIVEAGTVVLANAGDALRLIGRRDWPVDLVRGQISIAPATAAISTRLPLAGSGYLLPAAAGRVVFGATSQRGDVDGSVRAADHVANLAQLQRLLGTATDLDSAAFAGRTGWRCSADDRLPLIGAVPDPAADSPLSGFRQDHRLDQPRFVPRLPGLYLSTAYGSRGITWCALGARVLASWVTGSPAPVEASLLDAIDPARFVSRRVRKGSGPAGAPADAPSDAQVMAQLVARAGRR